MMLIVLRKIKHILRVEYKDRVSIKILKGEANEAFVSIETVSKKLNLIEK